ncbi:MAG: hypothetical protein JWL92_472 [Candidatus Nomurabacteria bacterium]|nr:hypothetical protein [Candidatus Nomurabacteria bacterium]
MEDKSMTLSGGTSLEIVNSGLASINDGEKALQDQVAVRTKIVSIGDLQCKVEDVSEYVGVDLVKYDEYVQASQAVSVFCKKKQIPLVGFVPFDSHLTPMQVLTQNNFVLTGLTEGKVSVYKAGLKDSFGIKRWASLTPFAWFLLAVSLFILIAGTYMTVEISVSNNEEYMANISIIDQHDSHSPVDPDVYLKANQTIKDFRSIISDYCLGAFVIFVMLLAPMFFDFVYNYLPDTIRRFYVKLMLPGNSNKGASDEDPSWHTVPISSKPLAPDVVDILKKCEEYNLPVDTVIPEGGLGATISRLGWQFKAEWGWKLGKGFCFIWKAERIRGIKVIAPPNFIIPGDKVIAVIDTGNHAIA